VNDAQRQLERLLGQAASAVPQFPPSSRYAATAVAIILTGDGRPLRYLRRRFVPSPEAFALLREHTVVEGDRIDLLAAAYFEDPELFWRLCDANGALRPEELTAVVGRRLRITLPEGIPGPQDDGAAP
jgi:hypothetical protein